MSDDPPFSVLDDCPNCNLEATVRWPPEDPDAVEIRCSRCTTRFEVAKATAKAVNE